MIIPVLLDAVREGRHDDVLALAQKLVCLDLETWMIQDAVPAPPLVCGSLGQLGDVAIPTAEGIDAVLLDRQAAREAFEWILDDTDVVWVNANNVFDALVMAQDGAGEPASRRTARRSVPADMLPRIWRMYEQGRVYDVSIAQQLGAIYRGDLGKDPRTGRKMNSGGRYSLATCVSHVLGRDDAKARDAWRLRYAELDDIPVEQWPEDAKIYPLHDARNTLEVALAQLGVLPRITSHDWGMVAGRMACRKCGGGYSSGVECFSKEPIGNLHSIHDQTELHWSLYLGAAWGFRVDQARVAQVKKKLAAERDAALPTFIEAGLIRPDGSSNTAAISRRVADAYGAFGVCGRCEGSGRIVSASGAKRKSPCRTCRVRPVEGQPGCEDCGVQCPECSATGLNLNDWSEEREGDDADEHVDAQYARPRRIEHSVPLTPKGRVSKARDVLDESGDDVLIGLADVGRTNKGLQTYIPKLEGVGDKPWCQSPNPLVETDRTSYSGLIQTFPRTGGLRECIVARQGYILCSTDYNFGEIITHAQSCLWILGFSDLADALLAKQEPHKLLGASMLGLDFPEFCRRFDDKKNPGHRQAKDARQAAKPVNFGLPGGMGAPKLVLTQRRQGPDTPCEFGPTIIGRTKTGEPIRGYRGLRFCILVAGAKRCGETKLTEWKGRECPPLCAGCLEVGEELRNIWFGQWSEMRPYFDFVSACVDGGQEPGLPPGTVIQHDSRIVRGGCNFNAAANGFFQSLLARAAKRAARWVQRECTDSTFRVPSEAPALALGSVSAYAGGESPLRGSRLVTFQHDENLTELWRPQMHDAAVRGSEIMVESLRIACPDLATVVWAPPALMSRWFKGSEPVVHGGRHVEWTPEHDPNTCEECAMPAAA